MAQKSDAYGEIAAIVRRQAFACFTTALTVTQTRTNEMRRKYEGVVTSVQFLVSGVARAYPRNKKKCAAFVCMSNVCYWPSKEQNVHICAFPTSFLHIHGGV